MKCWIEVSGVKTGNERMMTVKDWLTISVHTHFPAR